jgi:drug/metabolite transporter (DMT)-like permease
MRTERRGTRRADVALLSVTAIWGFTFPAIQLGLAHMDAVTFVALRFGLAAVVLALVFRGRAICAGWGAIRDGAALGLCLASGTLLQTVGLLHTSAPRSAFITALYVIIVPLLAMAIERVRPAPSSVAAVVLATAGLYLITGPAAGGLGLGEWLTLGCAVAFGLHIVVAEMAMARHDPVPVAFWQIVTAGVLAGLTLAVKGHPAFAITPWTMVAIGVAGLLATALAFAVQMWAQQETSATHAAVIFAAEPVFAAAFSYLLQGSLLRPLGFVGGALILAGVVVVQRGTRRGPP